MQRPLCRTFIQLNFGRRDPSLRILLPAPSRPLLTTELYSPENSHRRLFSPTLRGIQRAFKLNQTDLHNAMSTLGCDSVSTWMALGRVVPTLTQLLPLFHVLY